MFEKQEIRIVFLLGKPEKKQYQSSINFENKQYYDIVQGAFLDTYRNLSYKAVLGLRWVVENCGQAKFNLKIDDDVVVNTLRLLTLFTTKYSRINHSISALKSGQKARHVSLEVGIKIKLRSFKSSEHIYEKGDGPYRGFGYLRKPLQV